MSRISSFSFTSTLVDQAMARQLAVNTSQQQVTTGKKADTWSGYGSQVSLLVSTRSLLARTETYESTTKQLGVRLDQVDLNLTNIKDLGDGLRKTLLDAVSLQSGEGLRTQIEQQFKSIAGSLNAQYDGQYLFAGSQDETQPFSPQSLTDLSALASVSDGFHNDGFKAETRVADGQDLVHGIGASDIATKLMQLFKDLNDFDTGASGPLDGKLDASKVSFLESKLANLDAALKDVQKAQLDNGAKQKQVQDIEDRHTSRIVSLKDMVATIEDVDSATAITDLQNNRTALQASYQVLSQLGKLSLTNFL